MTETPAIMPASSQEGRADPFAWEVPELIALAVLVGVAVLAVGGLATGIVRSFSPTSSFAGSQDVWNAIEFGAQWANAILAAIVLGVLGVCWWQLEAWEEVREEPDSENDLSEALGHIQRTRRIISCTGVALGATAAGSVAGFVAQIGTYGSNPLWTLDILGAAEMLAVIVISGTGILVGRQLQR